MLRDRDLLLQMRTSGPRKLFSNLQGKACYHTASALRSLSSLFQESADFVETLQPVGRTVRRILKENARFQSAHAGRRAFVIGNGPSLRELNLTLLREEVTFTCNAFFLHPILSEWQPSYHCLMEDNLFDGTVERGFWFEEMRHKMLQTTFFVPAKWRSYILERNLLAENRTHFVWFSGHLCVRLKSVDITKPVPGGQSTVILAICLALYMGCSPIYLIGMDHDWLATRKMDTHFYALDAPYFHGSRLGTDLSTVPYDTDALSVHRLWAGYRNLKRFSEARGMAILNATNRSFLDVFDRVDYISLFGAAGGPSQGDLFHTAATEKAPSEEADGTGR